MMVVIVATKRASVVVLIPPAIDPGLPPIYIKIKKMSRVDGATCPISNSSKPALRKDIVLKKDAKMPSKNETSFKVFERSRSHVNVVPIAMIANVVYNTIFV